MIKLGEIFNKSRITTEDINNLIIDVIAYRGTMGSGEVWKILTLFGIKRFASKDETVHQKIDSLDQNQKNDLYYKLKNLMNVNEIKSSANPLDAPANLIVNGELDWEKLHNIFEKYKDKFFPEMNGEEYIDWVNEYIADSEGWEEETLDQLKNLTIGQVMGHLKGYIDYMNNQKGKKLFEIKPVPVVTPKIVWDIIREKYKGGGTDIIVDIGFLFEEFGYIKWSKEEGNDYEEYRRTNTSEKLIFLKYLQEQGKLVDFYRKLKAL